MPKLKSGTIWPTPEEEAAIEAGIAADAESPEWTDEDFARAKPASEFFDAKTYAALLTLKRRPGERGAQKRPVKVPTTIRFDAEVLAALKASGRGWQTRVNEAMKDWLRTHTPAKF
jgi:uncharacterized protein (DUF4415 family)